MRVLVMGCGPAGLIAAHAAERMYQDVLIFSKARKSKMFGAQYLHSPIPGLTYKEDQFKVRYELRGSAMGYRDKVYGPTSRVAVSPEELRGVHPAWDIRTAYDRLWDRYERKVKDVSFKDPEEIDSFIQWAKADIVISTIPATMLCLEGHTFKSGQIWSTDLCITDAQKDTVVCNGHDAPAWYRSSNIQGYHTTEWPSAVRPPIAMDHLWYVQKPLGNNCTCFPDVVRMGRYGRWQKGVLSHQAFNETQELIKIKAGK